MPLFFSVFLSLGTRRRNLNAVDCVYFNELDHVFRNRLFIFFGIIAHCAVLRSVFAVILVPPEAAVMHMKYLSQPRTGG